MLELLKDWVRNLITIVIFANIIEMILPDSSMRKYVKVVMGFFILLTLLNPLLNVLDINLGTFTTFDRIAGQNKEDLIKSAGDELKKQNQKLALETYQKQLEEQIKALVLTQPDVEDVEVKVKANLEGMITAVMLYLETQWENEPESDSIKINPIREVEIEISSNNDGQDKSEKGVVEKEKFVLLKEKTKKLLMNFYNLKPEVISFQ